MTKNLVAILGVALLTMSVGCGGAAIDDSDSTLNQNDKKKGNEQADPTAQCEAAGGSCVAIAPGTCANGQLGDASLCGGGIGVGCCLPAEEPASPGTGPGVANPAAVYCTQLGYALVGEDCEFADGTRCEQWSFYRGECGQAHSYCNLHGGSISSKTEDLGGWTSVYAVCTLPDGRSCPESTFSSAGDCP